MLRICDRSTLRMLAAAMLVVLAQCALGCDDSRPRRSDLFERAEQHYRRGEYETALDQYQAFVDRYPRSRMADTARLRIYTLTREVNSMLDRKDMPQPNYVGKGRGSPNLSTSSERPAPSSAAPPTRRDRPSTSDRDE